MLLTLSGSSPWDSQYMTVDGRVIYKVNMPMKLGGRRATITRRIGGADFKIISPSQTESIISDGSSLDSIGDYAQNDPFDLEKKFAHMAVVEFNILSSSRFRFNGTEVGIKTYFKKGNLGWNGRDRIFTGPDGCEYRWHLGATEPTLYLNDSSSTLVARYHKRWLVPWKTQPARLEILPIGEPIMDTIVMTLVYIERLRQADSG